MRLESSHPRIFISYARSDGKAVADELRRRLEKLKFALWQDLADLEGGKDWWLQIVEAIDHTEYLVLVMTPAALASPIVRKEWRYARQQGKCVIPVIAAGDLNFASMPGWMKRAHFVDTQEADQWRRFVRTLEAPCHAARVPLMLEDLPLDYVVREEELTGLLAALLDPAREEPIAITAALKGAGGYGKTTLARAIGHDERVQDAFTDGILWVTLGEQPGDLMGRVQDLIEVLSGNRPGFETQDAATARLAETLGERHMLMVIDDVWRAGDARPFLQGGLHCARLITTRNRDTLPPRAEAVDVDAMRGDEAVSLLRFDLGDGEDQAFAALAARLGEWPLLLKLANGAIQKRISAGQTLADALVWVEAALDRRGVGAFDPKNEAERRHTAAGTIEVSLQQLDAEERARFAELAVFPEDVDVPLDTVAMLWGRAAGLDAFDAEELLGRLFDLSLVLRLDLASCTLRLHDVIRAYLHPKPERYAALNAELVEGYRATCGGVWHEARDDGYVFHYLPLHLVKAGASDQARALAFDYRWLRRKIKVAEVNSLIADLARLEGGEEVQKIAGALRLSAHTLNNDPRQLAGQLLGRLRPDDGAEVADFLTSAFELSDRPALLPRCATFMPPGTGLIRMVTGHRGRVNALAILPERGQALSAGSDNTLRLWDLDSGRRPQRFEGHSGSVMALATLAERGQALSAGDDGRILLWSLDSGRERGFAGHSGWVNAVTALPEPAQALSAGADGTVRLWNLDSGWELQRFEGHNGSVLAIAALPERGQALSSGVDGTVRLWDLGSGRELQRFVGHSGWVNAIAALPDRGQALSAGDDGTVLLWDLDSGQELQRFEGHSVPVIAVEALPERGQALSVALGGTVLLWDLDSGQELQRFEGHGVPISAVAAVRQRSQALLAGEDSTVRLWDLASGNQLAVFTGDVQFSCCAVTPDGRFVVAGDVAGRVHLLEIVE